VAIVILFTSWQSAIDLLLLIQVITKLDISGGELSRKLHKLLIENII